MPIHRPGLNRWCCALCGDPTDQRHHIDYWSDPLWALIPLCRRHHTHLHRIHDRVRGGIRDNGKGVTISVVTARYLLDPDAARSLAITGDPYRQLSFADQATPQGEYWRRWDATGVIENRRAHVGRERQAA